MPTINKPIALPSGDSVKLLETSAMTGGTHVRAQIIFKSGGPLTSPHIHRFQDETLEVLSGRLAYSLNEIKRIAETGETVTLPRGVSHRHYAEGPEDVVLIDTMTPGLDFDYLLENLFGLGSEGRFVKGIGKIQTIVWLAKLKSGFTLPGFPIWQQKAVASIVTPVAYLFGYRAVYKRFSGEEW
jgi:quercetin dioxygenase-like cupin family protein